MRPSAMVALRRWLITEHGDGRRVSCCGCGEPLEFKAVTLDRFPIPGRWGGSYCRENVRAMCAPCNNSCVYDLSDEEVFAYASEHGITLQRMPSRPSMKRRHALRRAESARKRAKEPAAKRVSRKVTMTYRIGDLTGYGFPEDGL